MKKFKIVSEISNFTDELCEKMPEYDEPSNLTQLCRRLGIKDYSCDYVFLTFVIRKNMRIAYKAGFKKAKKLLK